MRFQPEGEIGGDREADILGLTPETFFYSLGTFGSISEPPSSHGGLFLIAAEPIHNSNSRG